MYIFIKAISAVTLDNGIVAIELPECQIGTEEALLLDKLFPKLQDAAWRLLNQEALLSAIVTQAEADAPVKKTEAPAKKSKNYDPIQ